MKHIHSFPFYLKYNLNSCNRFFMICLALATFLPFITFLLGNVILPGGDTGQGLTRTVWRPHAAEGPLVSIIQVLAQFSV